jgi:polyhydroxybutyrate depolymerase
MSRRSKIIAGGLVTVAVVAALVAWRTFSSRANGTPAKVGELAFKSSGPIADAAPAPRAPACGTAQPSPQALKMTTPSGRTFHVWGPATYDENHAYPVVLMFHGWSSNGAAFEKWFKMEEHVEGKAFTVYPDSRGPEWDFSGARDIDFTADILEALSSVLCIDRARVLAFGFSYGGRFVHHLGCKRPGLVRAIAAGGSRMDRDENGCTPMPVFVVHRTYDGSMRIAGGRESAERWAKIDGCDGTASLDPAHGCIGYRGCAAGAVTFCEDAHHDDSWPASWNHTVREEYRTLVWQWFQSL